MAKKHSKRFREISKKVDRTRLYTVREAMELLSELTTAKFDETVEIALRLGVDPRKAEENIRGTLVLPHGTGRTVRVAVIAKAEHAEAAEKAGAEVVGGDDLVEEIAAGRWDWDVLVAHVDMMKVVGRLGRVLGPRTPNKKSGTATEDVGGAVQHLKAGQIEYRVDRQSNMSCPLGRASFGLDKLMDNFQSLMAEVLAAKPAGLKGVYIRHVFLSTTMGPGLRIDVSDARDGATRKVAA
jgi:large subunit ribosomal protein L1